MAFGKQFSTTYNSWNGTEYTLDIYVDGYTGSSSSFALGKGGCKITCDTDGEDKFSPIIASTMTIPFIVENSTQDNFISSLRTSYDEKQVYVHLYADAGVVETKPLWSGFVIMELAAMEDVSYPFQVNLSATDGLGLLKDVDMVQSGATLPYSIADTYLPQGSTSGQKRVIEWIAEILSKTGAALTTEGAGQNYTIQSAINWYNDKMSGASGTDDPLYLTRCSIASFYEVRNDDTYKVPNCYEVLETLCLAWGMRCVYWNHVFHFVNVASYNTAESGTLAAPVNIPTREYYYTGGFRLNQDYLGSKTYTRYQLDFENVTAVGDGLQKLAETTYTNYPAIKTATAEFMSGGDRNYFNGFPTLPSSYSPGGSVSYIVETKSMGIINNLDSWDHVYIDIPVKLRNDSIYEINFDYQWSIRARAAGTTTWTHMLKIDWSGLTSGTDLYVFDTYVSTSSWGGWSSFGWGVYGTIFDVLPGVHNVNFNGPAGVIFVEPHSAFSGEWEFEFVTVSSLNESGSDNLRGHGSTHYSGAPYVAGNGYFEYWPTAGPVAYNNITNPGQNPPYRAIMCGVYDNAIQGSSDTFTATSSGSDTFIVEVGKTHYGDTPINTLNTFEVYDGAAWVRTDFAGDWGISTLTGSLSFTNLMLQERLYSQAVPSLKMNGSTALAKTDMAPSNKPKFVNPVGRVRDVDNRPFAMLRGSFNTESDQWQSEWFEITYTSSTLVYADQENQGPLSGKVTTGGSGGGLPGPGQFGGMMPKLGFFPLAVRDTIAAGTITSIPIETAASNDIFKSKDKIALKDAYGFLVEFEIGADVTAGDTALTVTSKAITSPITIGSRIGLSYENLFNQYQRKTEGSVGGMRVTATSLGPIGYVDSKYSIKGVNTNYIKILPRDFMINEDGGYEALEFKDATNTGLQVGDADQEMIATVDIPYGCRATEAYIWGSVTTKVVEVYAMDVDSNGKGSAIGTGTTDGSAITLTSTLSTETNYLMIIVKVTATSNRVYGGKITLTNT